MANLNDFVPIHTEDYDMAKLQDAIQKYISSLKNKIKELEARLEAGGL